MKSTGKPNFDQLYNTILENADLPPDPAAAPTPAAPAAEATPSSAITPDDPVIQKILSVILSYGAGKINNTEAAEQVQALLAVAPGAAEEPAAAEPPPATASPAAAAQPPKV